MCIVSPLSYELLEGRELLVLTQCLAQCLGPKQRSRMLPNEITQFSSLLRKCGIKVPATFREGRGWSHRDLAIEAYT